MVLSKTRLGSFRIHWMEWCTLLAFGLLGFYALSDPIGRSAVNSYQHAAQQFIDNRPAESFALVSRGNADVKDLSAISSRGDNAVSFGVLTDKLTGEGELAVPVMDVSQAVAAPNFSTTPAEQTPTEPATFQADSGVMTTEMDAIINDANTSFIPEDKNGTSLILNTACSRSDVLTGLCSNDTDNALDFLDQ